MCREVCTTGLGRQPPWMLSPRVCAADVWVKVPPLPDFTDCTVKPCTKQLHLTLAHKFYPHHQRTLEQLARAVHPGHSCQWTAALYSRDMRFVHYQVSGPPPRHRNR